MTGKNLLNALPGMPGVSASQDLKKLPMWDRVEVHLEGVSGSWSCKTVGYAHRSLVLVRSVLCPHSSVPGLQFEAVRFVGVLSRCFP